MPQGLFVTGTDTGVGKTLVSCALLHAYAATGKSVVGMKPVAAGCDVMQDGLLCDDVVQLNRAASVAAPSELVNPYAFAPPVAPHIAAAEVGVSISLEMIRQAYSSLARLADCVVVEGVGGFRVPLGDHLDSADLAQTLALPVVLVVGMRLGCLNHALLTAEAIAARGLVLAGWVANNIDPGMLRHEENLTALRERLAAPLLGVFGNIPSPDPTLLSGRLSLPGVLAP